jgi:hypothetical protein
MFFVPARFALHVFTAAALTTGFVRGPAHITVREVAASKPDAPVLLVAATHHDETAGINVIGRAEGMRDGKRVSQPLRVVRTGEGRYSIARQWQAGTPWLLVLTAEEGKNGSHSVAEALVKVDASGKVQGIEYPAPGWVEKTNTPKRLSPAEIDAALTSFASRR